MTKQDFAEKGKQLFGNKRKNSKLWFVEFHFFVLQIIHHNFIYDSVKTQSIKLSSYMRYYQQIMLRVS